MIGFVSPLPLALATHLAVRTRPGLRVAVELLGLVFVPHASLHAQAVVTVRLEENGKRVTGHSADTDIVVASARAYVAALNRLVVKRERTAPPVENGQALSA